MLKKECILTICKTEKMKLEQKNKALRKRFVLWKTKYGVTSSPHNNVRNRPLKSLVSKAITEMAYSQQNGNKETTTKCCVLPIALFKFSKIFLSIVVGVAFSNSDLRDLSKNFIVVIVLQHTITIAAENMHVYIQQLAMNVKWDVILACQILTSVLNFVASLLILWCCFHSEESFCLSVFLQLEVIFFKKRFLAKNRYFQVSKVEKNTINVVALKSGSITWKFPKITCYQFVWVGAYFLLKIYFGFRIHQNKTISASEAQIDC